MRDLASVVTIEATQKMFEKDRIVCATMAENAYEVIIPVTCNVGDKMVFIQEGAILPEVPTWEFLRKRCYNESVKGFVIKPMTMGKKEAIENGNPVAGERVKSWGLAVGLNECGLTEDKIAKLKSGDDLTDALGIRKYEPEEDASPKTGSKKAYPKWVKFCLSHTLTRWIGRIWQKRHQNSGGGFPTSVISKSDETTIQNYKAAITRFADELVYTSAKIEGQSFTALNEYNATKGKVGKFYVCSRNNAYLLPDKSVFWDVATRLDIAKKLEKFYKEHGKLLVIQGEQVGPGIQENIYDLAENDWYVYTIKDQLTGKQLPIEEMISVCEELELKTVPILQMGIPLKEIMPDVETAVAYAEKQYWKPSKTGFDNAYLPTGSEKLWKDYLQHEGVVVRSMNYDKDSNVGVSFKVKNLQYAEFGLGKMHSVAKDIKAAML